MAKTAAQPRLQKFAHAYWRTANGVQSARDAGFRGKDESLQRQAHRLLAMPEVKAELEKLRAASAKQAVVDRSEALDRWSEMLRFDIGPYLRRIQETVFSVDGKQVQVERLTLDIEKMAAEGKGHLVASLEFTDKGQIRIKFPDRQKALMELARLEGWYASEKHDVRHSVGDLSKLSDAELIGQCKELGIKAEG